jgi:repressor LexA
MISASAATYVLRVRGDSMVDAHIMDGDLVVIREQQTAQDGDIVVAQVEENAVTLKRFFKERDRVRLQPANDRYEPQYYDAVRIQGKLVGVIRRVD